MSKIFIADPVCVMPFGHNPVAINSFSRALAPYFDDVIPLVCEELSDAVVLPPNTDRCFSYYYHTQMKLQKWEESSWLGKMLRRDKRKVSSRVRLLLRSLGIPVIKDYYRAMCLRDWRAIIQKHQMTAKDVIFFPSGDYYGVRGLLAHLENLPNDERPVVHIHLINVMEHACKNRADAAHELFSDIQALGVVGSKVFLSAETPGYASHLSAIYMAPVAVLQFPPEGELFDLVDHGSFRVGIAGAARGDKGYFRLHDIITLYNDHYGADRIEFVVQAMSDQNAEFDSEYETQLSALPNLRKLSPRLSDEELDQLYADSDVLLLPYCKLTYQMRGSAVLSEAIAHGRPLVVGEGSAFGHIVGEFECGVACGQDADFARALECYRTQCPATRMAASLKARELYLESFSVRTEEIAQRLLAQV